MLSPCSCVIVIGLLVTHCAMICAVNGLLCGYAFSVRNLLHLFQPPKCRGVWISGDLKGLLEERCEPIIEYIVMNG